MSEFSVPAIIFVFFKPVVPKLQCESESPERLVKTHIAGAHSQSF